MKLKLFIFKILLLLLLSSETNATGSSDTIYICAGESLQLQTTPNFYSYTWLPNENISATDTYNPIVNPLVTTEYIAFVEPSPTTNLIYNGDFSLGNVGFDSEYFYTPDGTELQGFYGLFTNSMQFNSWFDNCEDHGDSTDGLMLIADGSTSPNKSVWCQQVGVEENETYDFSAWLTNVYWEEPSLILFSINGNDLGSPLQLETNYCSWVEFSANWFSGNNTSANICIESLNTNVDGNDFAIDDLSLSLESQSFVDTFLVVVLDHSSLQIDTSICANDVFILDGVEIPAGHQDTIFYTAFNGCDSLVYVNVTSIDSSYFETRLDTFCLGDTTYYMGMPITTDTSICAIYTNYLGCDSSICLVINFLSEATIDVVQIPPSCFGDSNGIISIEPTAGLAPYQYSWSTGANSSTINNLSSGFYSVTISDANGCMAEKQIVLEDPLALSTDYSIIEPSCFGLTDGQIFFLISGGTPDYFISFEDQGTSTDLQVNNIGSGNYNVSIEDYNGCSFTFNIPVDEPASIDITLPNHETVLLGHPHQIHPQITGTTDYQIQWFPAAHLSCSTCLNPITTTLDDISYQITVEDNNGCSTSESITIHLQNNFELYIPNAFSPNGDGINDFFELYLGKGVKGIKSFQIFNRWGALIFQRANFISGDLNARWDGTFNGQQNDSAVFTYFAEVVFLDGREKVFEGSVLLIR